MKSLCDSSANLPFLRGLSGPLHEIILYIRNCPSFENFAVWRGLLTPLEFLFSLKVSRPHSFKPATQHHTSADLHAQAKYRSQTRKTSAEHTLVLALYQKLIPSLKCTMTKHTAFQKGHLHSTILGHMEIIKPACKAVRISKAIYLPQCSAQPRLTQPSYQRNPVLWAEPIKLKRRVRCIVCTRPDTHADLSCGILLHSTVSHDFSSSETWTSVKMTLGHHHHPCTWAQTTDKWKQ